MLVFPLARSQFRGAVLACCYATWQVHSRHVRTLTQLSKSNLILGLENSLAELAIQGIPVYLTLSQGAKIQSATRIERITLFLYYLRRDGVICWTAVTGVCYCHLSPVGIQNYD